MRNVSDKICIENRTTHFLFNNFFLLENGNVYEIIWKNIAETDRTHMIRMHIACWIPKATETHSEYVILIAFPQKR